MRLQKDYKGTIEAYKKALELLPEYNQIRLNLTQVKKLENNYNDAINEYKKFLEFFKDKPNVEYVINCYSVSNRRFIWIIPYSQLSEYEKDVLNYEQMQFITFKPQVMGFRTLIPKGE